MAQEKYPQEAKIIRDNTYMDDIIESVGDRERPVSVTRNIEKLIDIGGFKIKGWTISGSSDSRNEKDIPSETYAPADKVLGVCWGETRRGPVLLQGDVEFLPTKEKAAYRAGYRIPSTKREVSCEVDKANDSLPDQQHL